MVIKGQCYFQKCNFRDIFGLFIFCHVSSCKWLYTSRAASNASFQENKTGPQDNHFIVSLLFIYYRLPPVSNLMAVLLLMVNEKTPRDFLSGLLCGCPRKKCHFSR